MFRPFRYVWRAVEVAGTVAWLGSIGGSAIVTGIMAAILDLPNPWVWIVPVGVFLIVLALLLAGVRYVNERRAARRSGRSATPRRTVFAELENVESFNAEGNVSDADTFLDAKSSSDVTLRDNVQQRDEQSRKQ